MPLNHCDHGKYCMAVCVYSSQHGKHSSFYVMMTIIKHSPAAHSQILSWWALLHSKTWQLKSRQNCLRISTTKLLKQLNAPPLPGPVVHKLTHLELLLHLLTYLYRHQSLWVLTYIVDGATTCRPSAAASAHAHTCQRPNAAWRCQMVPMQWQCLSVQEMHLLSANVWPVGVLQSAHLQHHRQSRWNKTLGTIRRSSKLQRMQCWANCCHYTAHFALHIKILLSKRGTQRSQDQSTKTEEYLHSQMTV